MPIQLRISGDNLIMKLSPEAKNWIEKRTQAIQLKARFYEDGGHVMLKDEVYRVDLLPEPLRTEVEKYDQHRVKQRLKDEKDNLVRLTESSNREEAIKAKGKLLADDETTWWFRRPKKGT